MSDAVKWTSEQEKAIEARGMQVLVSAAAGSGKTKVLTERVKNILCDVDNPCSVSQVLVVTFTRAAAGEMRDRIYSALRSVSANTPNSDYLKQQMLLLPTADISTIDSFCSKIVKENFGKADISVDFSMLDDKELAQMTDDAVNDVLEYFYEENEPAFIKLTTMFLGEKNDDTLPEIIKKLYNFSRSYPSPEKYLNSLIEMFSPDNEPNDTPWADYVYKYIGLMADFHSKRLNRCVSLLEDCGGFTPLYLERFVKTGENFFQLKQLTDDRNWDGVVSKIKEGILVAPATRNSKVNEYLKSITASVFDDAKDDVGRLTELTLPTTDEHKADCVLLLPIVKKLCEAVNRLSEKLNEVKKEQNSYSFDDIIHKCIGLLVEFTDDGWVRTPVAESLRDKYKEILIDEFQDTNEAQNIIFQAISRDKENLYCVGDVKQSIYKFRLASPELFMDLKHRLSDYDGGLRPSQINLDRNFRSRLGVTEITNSIFKCLMTETVGEINYNEKESLVCGAKYFPKNTPDSEILAFDFSDSYAREAIEKEAENIAVYVDMLIKSKVLVQDGDNKRPIRSSDICILLRSTKNKVNKYSDALKNRGIPTNTVIDGDIGSNKEILLLSSFMKVINNPLIDVPLISVLFSPVFGFTADELAEIRMTKQSPDLYSCLCEYAITHPKAKRVIDKLNLYRNVSVSKPINEFVRFLVKDTDISNIYSACNDGAYRKGNVRSFIDFADKFTENGKTGLGSFIRSLDSAIDSKKMTTYAGSAAPVGVNIMTIHKSKGLEFPYVIVADCSSFFNKFDSKNQLKIARATGVGMKIRDDEDFTTYNTVSSIATEKDILFGGASEELRVLYVASTRAKEHITFVCSLVKGRSYASRVKLNKHFSIEKDGKLHPYAVYRANSFSEWIISALINHQDFKSICDKCEIEQNNFDNYNFSIDVNTSLPETVVESDSKEEVAQVDYQLLRELESKLSYDMSADDSSHILAKVTASSRENTTMQKTFFAKKKPKFMTKTFTGADRGNAIHKFLELCDFYSASKSCVEEKDRLLKEGKITQDEYNVVDSQSVNAFFNSTVGNRLLNSDKILKEYEFSFMKKAKDLYRDIPSSFTDEEIFIQGKLDCAFVEGDKAVLIDYKTDNITDENKYREIYLPQINIYAESLKQCTGCDVTERYIYSFKLKKFITI